MSEDELVSLPKFLDDMDMPDCAAAVRQLIADARRYQWLRNEAKEEFLRPAHAGGEYPDLRTHWKFPVFICSGPVGGHIPLDAAIDQAMQEKGE